MSHRLIVLLAVVSIGGLLGLPAAVGEEPGRPIDRADRLFTEKNYAEAARAYELILGAQPDAETMRRANRRLITSYRRLNLHDKSLEAAEAYVGRTKGTRWEARAERLCGNLWLAVPHWGTRAGGVFHRNEWKQGIQLQSHRHDKKHSLKHLERARELYASYDDGTVHDDGIQEDWRKERIACLFDLAGAVSRFGIYEPDWQFWYGFWGERDDETNETAGEQDFAEYHGNWALRRKRPIGLRLDTQGAPIFATMPPSYAADLSDDGKLLYLLGEVRGLDPTEERTFAATATYRQAMLARARFGMDRLNEYAGMYWSGSAYPLQEELKAFRPWELQDAQGLILAGGKIQVAALPPQWDVIGLLRTVQDGPIAPEALYAHGVYHQSRQQYTQALARYLDVRERFGSTVWAKHATAQDERIRQPQIRIANTGVQLSGEPARLQVSYRNVQEIHYVARRIDLVGFFENLRSRDADRYRGMPGFYSLGNWASHFVNGSQQSKNWVTNLAAKYIGEEVGRWTEKVADDGTHRYAEATFQSALTDGGTVLVYAYAKPIPAAAATARGSALLDLGASRAALVLTDLALVDKPAKDGMLYFIADARNGAPVAGATIDLVETWSVWNPKKRKSEHFKETRSLTTDETGLALDKQPKRQRGQIHALVRAEDGARIAFSGMRYWDNYHPSGMRDGVFAYAITDRPVYRPNQTVRYKTWLRHRRMGLYGPMADTAAKITIYDPRGSKVQEITKRTDEFGGLDGELVLGDEPKLGMYRIQIHNGRHVGGQNFRVEEYKKPEFEVKVEPGKTHAKLGETLHAKIKATYYFGAPVANGTVAYKVFREEYRHQVYPRGRWNWLYGPGYGYGFYGRSWSPVRELVSQGDGRIGEDGTLDVEIHTADALRDHPDRDHRYVIQAEVRDPSRRVIKGEGAVKVTRQAFYANLWSSCGWNRPGEEFEVTLKCTTPDGTPVETEGVLTVSDVVFGGPGNAKIEETELERFTLKTDARGEAKLRLRHEKSGRLKLAFRAPDQWGGTVEGYGHVWIVGRDFDGKLHRFNDLELLTDKRTYAPGDVAHVMVNVKQPGSWVLFGDEVDNNALLSWRMLHVAQRSIVVDVPIEAGDQPNIFVEATCVRDMRTHSQAKRICVPPEKGVIDVQVTADKPTYQPGEKAQVSITATNLDGTPADAQVVVSAFDRSVLYIQPSLTPSIRPFFHGHLRRHSPVSRTNLLQQFAASGYVHRPFQQLYPLPPAWHGVWTISGGAWGGEPVMGSLRRDGEDGAEGGITADACAPTPCAPADGGMGQGASRGRLGGRGGGADKSLASRKTAAEAGPGLVEAEVRTKFADTALWAPTIRTGDDGKAETTFDCPENLTTWEIQAWGMTKGTRVGQARTSAVTTKNLIVRLQAPRFFLEYDEVVLSANVHNYLDSAKTAQVSLSLPAAHLEWIGGDQPTVQVEVAAGGETRVDWRVRVKGEGVAKVRVDALTDEESDAMQLTFPVMVHGMTKQVAATASMRPHETEKSLTIELDVPEARRPELTQLEVQFAPTLVGAMLDALPYCLHYPYGCTEQTMSRFVPAVLTLKTLRQMGLSLEDLKTMRSKRTEKLWSSYADSVVFDPVELQRIIDKGLKRIQNMQHSDGGWGWWTKGNSNSYLTTYVVWALLTAQHADVAVPQGAIDKGLQFLKRWEESELKKKEWRPHAQHAFLAHVLSSKSLQAGDLIERLWKGRDAIGLYGKALLTLAMSNLGDDRASTVLRNILQFVEVNEETQVASFRMPTSGWWYWWNSDVETTAWILRAIVRVDPKSDLAPKLVKWLLNNRKNGYYWRSTRDTTMCVAAMSDFVRVSGEGEPDYTIRLDLDDGAVVKEVKISKANLFTYDNRFVVEGVALSGGKHKLRITKTGPGALYVNSYLRYFTKEVPITAAGHELKVERTYFRLKQIPYEVEVEGSKGQKVMEKRLRYERVPVKEGDELKSGEILQVELRVKSDNHYTYLCLEDMKPAGCEPLEVRSGGKGQEGFASYMELRDEKTVFFLSSLGQGEHLLRYRLRAEIPGRFHALPTKLFAMYVPELRANADEAILEIVD